MAEEDVKAIYNERVSDATSAAEDLPQNADKAQTQALLAIAEILNLTYDRLSEMSGHLYNISQATGARNVEAPDAYKISRDSGMPGPHTVDAREKQEERERRLRNQNAPSATTQATTRSQEASRR